MSASSSRRRRGRFGLIALTAVMAATGVAITAAPAHAAQGTISGATLEWGLNTEVQSQPPAGGCNYFSAGESDGTQATYAAVAGNVAVVKNGGTPTWANHCTLTGGNANQKFVISNGTGTLDTSTGASTIHWTGTASVNFYGGLAPFWFSDPTLTMLANGTGEIVADLGGYASSQENPTAKVPLDPVEDVVIARVSNVTGANRTGFTITPNFAGVLYDAPEGNTPQNRTNAGWGSWPASFVDFQNQTGLSSYWYSSGASGDVRKPPTAITVGYGAFTGAPGPPGAVVAKSGSTTTATGPLVVTFTAPANNGGSPITGYTATCTSSNGGVTKTGTRAGAAAGPITVAAATTAKSYTCKVRATNAHGLGDLSSPSAAVIVGSPAPPQSVVSRSGSTAAATGPLVVTFAIGANNGSPIQNQTATCTSSNGGVTRSGTHTGAAAAAITVAATTTGKTYTCRVTAKNARGVGLASAVSLPVIVGSPAPPTAPHITRPAAGQLRMTYTLGANNGSPIQSKTATCVSSNGGVAKAATHTGATAAPITVTGLTVGKSYTCTVRAKNARGLGLASGASNALTA
jgi:hypothetical protein